MATGDIKEKVEDIPTLAFSTVCGELGLTSEDEVMSAYHQIKDVLGVYTRYLGNYIRFLRNRDNQKFHLKAVADAELEIKVGGNRIWKIKTETVIRPGIGDDEWYVCEDRGEPLNYGVAIQTDDGFEGYRVLDESNFKRDSNLFWFKFPELRRLNEIKIFGTPRQIRPSSFSIKDDSKLLVDGRSTEFRRNEDGTVTISARLSNSTISVDGSTIGYDIERPAYCPPGAFPYDDGYIIQSPNEPQKGSKDITDQFLGNCQSIDLIIDGVSLESLGFVKTHNTRFSSSESDLPKTGILSHIMYEDFRIPYSIKQSASGRYRIVPEEDYATGSGKDTDSGRDPWDSVFDDNVMLKKGKETLEPLRKYREAMELLFKREDLPKLGEEFDITVEYDMRDLKQQLEALTRLQMRPSLSYAPLYNLFRQVQGKGNWGRFEPADESDWYVLDDGRYEGCTEQRQLVNCALATTDFAVLDGPPGTGKTTAIRELIIKLIMSGKRVLVASSTNAAIDNVLEWLIEKDCEKNPEFKEKLVPVRLGLEDKTSDRVKAYSMQRMKERFKSSSDLKDMEIERLILDSSNLVCGTIARVYGSMSPYVEKEDMWKRKTAYVPPFDYLIMDESSKTTFQEFIVPALYAKRWILAGDVRQLSPFTDEGAAENLLSLFTGSDTEFRIDDNAKRAIALINVFSTDRLIPRGIRCVVIVHPQLWFHLEDQLATMEQEMSVLQRNGQYRRFKVTNRQYCFNMREPNYSKILDTETRVIYVNRYDYPNARYFLDKDSYIIDISGGNLNLRPWANHIRKNNIEVDSDKLMEEVSKSWESQIRWRLERDYWLRRSKKDNQYISQIYCYIPGAIYSDEMKRKRFMKKTVYAVQGVLYHSILELLTVPPKDEDRRNLLQSFNDKELANRKVSLIYQHRMDPDISKTPKNEFYGGNLLDGSNVNDRGWNYYIQGAEGHRSVWIQCETDESRSVNTGEIDVVMSELKKFIRWAEANPRPEGKQYEVILLTFYQRQKMIMRERLDQLDKSDAVHVKVATVDYIQGQEADVVFLSMVRRKRVGFMDTPNRLNVAITRARELMVYIGDTGLFLDKKKSAPELISIVEGCEVVCRD